MNRHKKTKEVKELIPPYLISASFVFPHPYHYFCVIICSDYSLKIFDIPSMSILAEKADDWLQYATKSNLKCLFTKNPNIFYLLASTNSIKMFEIMPGQIQSQPAFNIEVFQDDTLLQCTLSQTQSTFLQVLVERGLLVYDIGNKKQWPITIEFNEPIRNGIPLNALTWILFSQSKATLAIFEFYNDATEETIIKLECQIHESIKNEACIIHDRNKNLIGFETDEATFCVMNYSIVKKEMELIFRISLHEDLLVARGTFFGYGVNTNTSHKYQKKILLVMVLEKKVIEEMDDESEIKNIFREPMIYEIDLEVLTFRSLLDSPETREFPIVKQLHNAVQMWDCEAISNKLCVLNSRKEFIGLDMTVFLQGKNIAKQWVNLGYKFEALSSNLMYAEEPEDFEQMREPKKEEISKNEKNRLLIEDLQDWSHSLLPKQMIMNRVQRLNCFEF